MLFTVPAPEYNPDDNDELELEPDPLDADELNEPVTVDVTELPSEEVDDAFLLRLWLDLVAVVNLSNLDWTDVPPPTEITNSPSCLGDLMDEEDDDDLESVSLFLWCLDCLRDLDDDLDDDDDDLDDDDLDDDDLDDDDLDDDVVLPP